MKLHEIKDYRGKENSVFFRKQKVESGFMYNYWNIHEDDYNQEWIFVPSK